MNRGALTYQAILLLLLFNQSCSREPKSPHAKSNEYHTRVNLRRETVLDTPITVHTISPEQQIGFYSNGTTALVRNVFGDIVQQYSYSPEGILSSHEVCSGTIRYTTSYTEKGLRQSLQVSSSDWLKSFHYTTQGDIDYCIDVQNSDTMVAFSMSNIHEAMSVTGTIYGDALNKIELFDLKSTTRYESTFE